MFRSTGIAFSSLDLGILVSGFWIGFCFAEIDFGSKFLMEELVMLPKNLFSLNIAGDFIVFQRESESESEKKRERSECFCKREEV